MNKNKLPVTAKLPLSDEDAEKLKEALGEQGETSTTPEDKNQQVPKPKAKAKAKQEQLDNPSKPLANVETPKPSAPLRGKNEYDDGIVKGTISTAMGACDVCGTDRLTVLLIDSVELPPIVVKPATKKKPAKTRSFKPHPSLIMFRGSDSDNPQPVKQMGITCGCLAKAHRQLARIDQRIKDRGA